MVVILSAYRVKFQSVTSFFFFFALSLFTFIVAIIAVTRWLSFFFNSSCRASFFSISNDFFTMVRLRLVLSFSLLLSFFVQFMLNVPFQDSRLTFGRAGKCVKCYHCQSSSRSSLNRNHRHLFTDSQGINPKCNARAHISAHTA